MFCVAAPIRNNLNEVISAISCTISKKEIRYSSAITDQIREVVMQQAEEISQELGAIAIVKN